MGDWKSVNHSKYLLQYHLILVCKYRKRLLSGNNISSDIKKLSIDICLRHDVMIRYIGLMDTPSAQWVMSVRKRCESIWKIRGNL